MIEEACLALLLAASTEAVIPSSFFTIAPSVSFIFVIAAVISDERELIAETISAVFAICKSACLAAILYCSPVCFLATSVRSSCVNARGPESSPLSPAESGVNPGSNSSVSSPKPPNESSLA